MRKVKEYKNKYNRMPINMSSTKFLSVYTLHYIVKKDKPVYGLEIINTIRNIYSKNVWYPSHSTLYPLLEQMVDNSLLYVHKIEHNRKYYNATEEGILYLTKQKEELKEIIYDTCMFFNNIREELYGD